MEKLKAKHDHKLTDILKVMIFALFLILPGLIVLPSMLYYGVNEHATAPTKETEIYEYKQINFNQQIVNGDFQNSNSWSVSRYQYTINNNHLDIDLGYAPTIAPYSIRGQQVSCIENHVYILKFDYLFSFTSSTSVGVDINAPLYVYASLIRDTDWHTLTRRIIPNRDYTGELIISPYLDPQTDFTGQQMKVANVQLFDLTQMYGYGNEPTNTDFNNEFTNDYYNYTKNELITLEIDTGTTATYTDITSQIQYNWTSLWQQPLFSWTNYTIVKQGIDNFTGVFGITNTSNISNLIAYELIIVAIYIVIDIVLTLFKWLTHLIGEK